MLDDAAGYNSCSTSTYQWTNIPEIRNEGKKEVRRGKRKRERKKKEGNTMYVPLLFKLPQFKSHLPQYQTEDATGDAVVNH